MTRTLFAAALLLLAVPPARAAQDRVVLHIKVSLAADAGSPTPVARHALLISDNPATAAPRRVVTGPDGTIDVRLRPGNYTVESDEPVVFLGKSYQWTQTLDVRPGADSVLELTAGNAEIGAATASSSSPDATAPSSDPMLIAPRWKDSVVALWTPASHASGFLIDARGLVATSQRAIGTATAVEVQLSPSLKVEGRILAADATHDVVVVWVDPATLTGIRPVPLACGEPAKPAVEGDEAVALGITLRGQPDFVLGDLTRVAEHDIVLGSRIAPGAAGGPVFSAADNLIGLTSVIDETAGRRRESRVVPAADACDVVRLAEQKMAATAKPSATHLPVEPSRPFPEAALEQWAERRSGGMSPYVVTASEFEVSFITPPMIYARQHGERRTTSRDTRMPPQSLSQVIPWDDFGVWAEYFLDAPPVLTLRIAPKMVQGFWSTLARGAAMTQGMSLPSMKHFGAALSRMRAFCGETEVMPIHPFVLETAVRDNVSVLEGLYVFAPDALGPQCATVKLMLYSEKDPNRADTRTIDPAVVNQIWKDFEPFRQQH